MSNTAADDNRLENLLKELTAVYLASSSFRRGISTKRVEAMLPAIADFAAMSSSIGKPEASQRQRVAAAAWLGALIEKSSSRLPNSVIIQVSRFD